LNDETAYIRLTQFGGNAGTAFKKVMALFKAESKKNLILDLRENGGGYLDVMREIASYFCKGATEKKPIVAVADFGEKKQVYKATDNLYNEYFSNESRICVLADSGTASASEALIGCMLDYGAVGYGDVCLAERNGVAKTYGKGIMQATYFVGAQKDAIKLTTAEILWPISETSIHTRGILPQDGAKTVSEGVNDQIELESAINALF
jgi:carboxyl-terminal processing protease